MKLLRYRGYTRRDCYIAADKIARIVPGADNYSCDIILINGDVIRIFEMVDIITKRFEEIMEEE